MWREEKKNVNRGCILTHLIVVKGAFCVFLVLLKQQVAKFLQLFPFAQLWSAGIVPLKPMLLSYRPKSSLHRKRLYDLA